MRQVLLQGADGLLDQSGAVVERNYRHFGHGAVGQGLLREARLHFVDLCFHVIDHMKRVGAVTGYHHAAHGFHSFLVEPSASGCGSQGDKGHILYFYRHAIPDGYYRFFKVRHMPDVSQPSDQVLHLIDLGRFGANVKIALLYGVHHIHDGGVVGPESIGIHLHLVLLHKTSDGGNFCHSLCRGECILGIKILYCPQLVGVPPSGRFTGLGVSSFEGIPEYLSQGGCIRSERGLYAVGQRARREGVEFLQDTGSAPVKFDIFFKDDVDKRHPEHGRASDSFHTRDTQQRSGQRVGNLLLNIFRRTAHPLGSNDLLVVTQVRDGIYRYGVAWQQTVPVKWRRGDSPYNDDDE